MKKKPLTRLERRIEGLRINANCVRLIYKTLWSDGTTSYEQGNYVYGHSILPRPKKGTLQERSYRGEIGILLQAVSPIIDTLEGVCMWADTPIPKKKRRKLSKTKRFGRKTTRVVEI